MSISIPLRFSLIIPVFNRHEEVLELLESLTVQSDQDFEVVIVEDGSTVSCEQVVKKYISVLRIAYYYKSNSGPGLSRNYGATKASGNYFIFLDSDCVIPRDYIRNLRNYLVNIAYKDAFGGPDMADTGFTTLQKAINYSMTSFITTGGIRGGGEKLDKFHPRSFNMGYSQEVFETTNGFSNLRFGEDIDMSIRIIESGFSTVLIKDAAVYHKRRTSFKQFYKQVYNSGIARINLYLRYPFSLKLVHALPSLFVIGLAALAILSLVYSPWFLFPIIALALIIFFDSLYKTSSLKISLLSVLTAFTQLIGYGLGFLVAVWKRLLLRKDEFSAFTNTFYD